MMISSRAASTPAPTYAQAMQARDASRAAKAEEKRAVAENVAEAMSSSRMDAPERAKRDAKAKLIDIAKRIQLLKKLFAGNPKEMARALTQVFKELRAAVKAYKDAGGAELSMAGEAAKVAVANDDAPKTEAAPDADDARAAEGETPAPAETAPADGEKPPADEQPTQTPAQGSALYEAVVGKMRKSIGEDGLDFIKMVRQLVSGATGLRDMLEAARTQAKAKKPDKDTDEAFEDADKEMKALADDLSKMDRDIRNAAPEAGMKLLMDA
jgi:hypothetical protein